MVVLWDAYLAPFSWNSGRLLTHIEFWDSIHTQICRRYCLRIVHKTETGIITTDWYPKPKSSGIFINHLSEQPIKMIINAIFALNARVIRLSYPSYNHKNLQILAKLFMKNCCPSKKVNNLIYNICRSSVSDSH